MDSSSEHSEIKKTDTMGLRPFRAWRLAVGILVVALTNVGCAPAAARPSVATVTPTVVSFPADLTVQQAAQLWQEGAITVIDVREPSEFAAGHIPGAVLLPLTSLAERIGELPADRPILLVCRSGNRSSQAYRFLKENGYADVHNMLGGMIEWERSGLDIER